LGINSSRGKAMEAALEYAQWVFNHHKSSGCNFNNFESMPEFKKLIEYRLTSPDRTPGELALIGSKTSLIYAIDKQWLQANVSKIFPLNPATESSPKAIEWAAWNAFLVWSQPHVEFYRLFKKQFTYAIEQSIFVLPSTYSNANPIYRLGEHLMILYIRGEVPLEEKGILRRFLSESKFETRRHTIDFIGRLLDRHKTVSNDIITRCEQLWEVYWMDKGQADAQNTPSAWSFDSWFSSGKFLSGWSLDQLEKYLEVTKTPEISNQVVEELVNIADTHISRVLDILSKIIQSDKEGWHISSWQNYMYIILELAMKKDGDVCDKAQLLINLLGRYGYTNFGKLLY